jgi:transcriptional regulator NrdR family protein
VGRPRRWCPIPRTDRRSWDPTELDQWAETLYDLGNSTAAPKLEQQANDLELDLARLKQQQAEAELEDIDSEELVDFICDAVEDEKDLGVELAAQVYRALRNREDFEDIVDACAE